MNCILWWSEFSGYIVWLHLDNNILLDLENPGSVKAEYLYNDMYTIQMVHQYLPQSVSDTFSSHIIYLLIFQNPQSHQNT